MASDPHLQQLLEEILDSRRTPEEACEGDPVLLQKVRERLGRLRAVEAQVDVLFPPKSPWCTGTTPPVSLVAELPQVPGYQVQAILGRGGMGIVYRAWDCRLNRPVALKMLLAGDFARPEEIARFLQGAEAKACLRHANIVQVYDLGDLDGKPYFTMEFAEGGTLAQRISGTPLPAGQAAGLLETLARAVEVAHEGGIVHRDLKPANVLLTSDGTPKITDFGLARRLRGSPVLTHSGAMLGTPSYMAPEQALGRPRETGPAADIYALGAILYEMLTGRPPFRAETAEETMRQVIEEDPLPPSRSNPKVPRDLETICLKCLHKEPQDRYATAAVLAEDLRRFQRGETIVARPAGRPERLARWLRRRRAPAAVLAVLLMLLMGLAACIFWLSTEQEATVRGVEDDLRELARSQHESDWARARIALERAKGRLGRGGPAFLFERLDQARRDLDQACREQQVLARLDAIHLGRMILVEGRFNAEAERRFNQARADRDYEAAFLEAGFGPIDNDPEGVTARVAASGVRPSLLAGLDDWATCAGDPRRRASVLRVARRADPDPWRDRLRDPSAWADRAALAELARTAAIAEQPLPLLVALGERLRATGGDGIGFLARVRQVHPADFWTNLAMGNAQQEKSNLEAAVDGYREALKSGKGAAAVSNNLGLLWYSRFYLPQAIECYQQALRIDPRFAPAHNNFGLTLRAKGALEDAIGHYRDALSFDPELAPAHANLGEAEAVKGEFDEAIVHDRQALRIDPEYSLAHYNLGVALMARGRMDEANERHREALRIDPGEAKAHEKIFGFAIDEGVVHFHQALRIDPKFAVSHNNLGIAPRDARGLDEAIGHYERALAIEPGLGKAHASLGQALLALGRFRQAATEIRRGLDLIPRGDELHDNVAAQLRRCERLLALQGRLTAVLEGRDRPGDPAEVLEFAELCGIEGRVVAAARLDAEAFASSPGLAEDLRAGHRYTAACAAALAGCGRGADAARLGEEERARWRRQAREWLRADLALWARALESGPNTDRVLARRGLAHLWTDPDLAGLLDRDSSATLPPAERQECLTLRGEIEALFRRAQVPD